MLLRNTFHNFGPTPWQRLGSIHIMNLKYTGRSFYRTLSLIFSLIIGLAASVAAQDAARLEGTIRDPQGAVVAGATIKVTSAALGVARTATTNAEGFYSVPQLRAGVYAVAASQDGFSTSKVDNLELGVGQTRNLDLELALGQVGAVVDVTSSAELATVDTSSNRLGVNVTAREVSELPVNGRNYSQLQLLTPGAVNSGTGNFNEIRFNGRSNQQNQTRLDGVESTAVWDASPGYLTVQGSQFRLQTSLENIQEFRVDSSNYPAEYGTGTGGQINVVGKSGSNDFRGSVFHYFRNDALDARNFFDGADKSKLRLNQFGGSFGGRIIKDKLFFFGSYEGLRQRAGFNVLELTPSGFSRDFINFYGTADARGEAARAALGLSVTDANAALTRIQNLRATGILNAFPTGAGANISLGGVPNAAQFIQANRVASLDENAYSGRIDWKINERFNFLGRFQRSTGSLAAPDGSSGRFLVASQQPDNLVLSLTQLYGTNIVNETKFGLNRAPTQLRTTFPDVAGVSGVDLAATAFRLGGNIVSPGINGGATTGLAEPGGLTRQSSAGNGRAQPIRGRSLSVLDNLILTDGNHTRKFGVEVRLNQVHFDQLGGTVFSYGSIRDFLLNQNLTAAYIGDLSVAGNFTLQTNPLTTIERTQSGPSLPQQYYLIGYGQDEWRIRPNLTVNYGLRYEYYSAVREKDNRAIIFDPNTGTLQNPAQTNFYRALKTNFAPRFGLTWSPERFNGKTVFRLGGGLFYGPGQFEDLIQPIESDVFRSTTTIAGGLTTATAAAVASTANPVSGFTPRAYDVRGYRVPERVGQYGFTVQQELPGNTVLTVGYVGSQGRNLFLRSVTNTIRNGVAIIGPSDPLPNNAGVVNRCSMALVNGVCNGNITATTTIRQFDVVGFGLTNGAIVANPNSRLQPFGEIDYKTSGGRDNYNAMQVTVNRRFTAGLTLGGQYQWSHSIGTSQGSNDANTTQDPFNFNNERGNNTFDIRHSANFTALYELPLGKGRMVNLNGFADALLGGWQVGSVYNGRSGTPINVLLTRADLAIQCVQTGGCPNGSGGVIPVGTTGRFSAPSAASPLPTGFIAVINTPGGNASRNTRRPDLVAGVNPYTTSGGLSFLNPGAFTIPKAGSYGNLSRNALHGPSFHQFDLTLQKRFRMTEGTNIEFRTEIYNVFNKANFANPPVSLTENLPSITFNSTTGITTVGSGLQPGQPFTTALQPNFGLINGTVGRTVGLGTNRQLQFSLRLNF